MDYPESVAECLWAMVLVILPLFGTGIVADRLLCRGSGVAHGLRPARGFSTQEVAKGLGRRGAASTLLSEALIEIRWAKRLNHIPQKFRDERLWE